MITLVELLNALQALEQRRVMRQDYAIEGALPVKHHVSARNNKNKKGKKHQGSNGEYTTNNNKSKAGNKNEPHPPYQHCGGKSHLYFKCQRRPNSKCTKCNQMGHETVICKNKNQQHGKEAQVADQVEDQLFVVACFSSMESSESWLIDSGYTRL